MQKPLVKYGLIKVSGSDAGKFLQGQLTNNIENFNSLEIRLAAHCNTQGRVVSLFNIFHYQDSFYMFLPYEMIAITMAALKKYIVFFKATMTDVSDEMDKIEVLTPIVNDLQTWKANNIHLGVPAIYPATSGMFLPHDLNLPALHAVDFDKGCYTGQEIIARMHYRGKPKNHLLRTLLHCNNKTQLLPGEDIYYEAGSELKVAGTLVDTYPLKAENEEYTSHLALIVCDGTNAKNQHLFLKQAPKEFLTILEGE